MINSLKIVLCSLKLVKRLLRVQNNSPIMNTPKSPFSPLVNTQYSLNSVVMNPMGNIDYPVMNTPESRLFGVFWTSFRTGLQKISGDKQTPQCIYHRGVLTTWWILPRNNFKFFQRFTELPSKPVISSFRLISSTSTLNIQKFI